MIPKPMLQRLSTTMQFMDTTWQMCPPTEKLPGLAVQPLAVQPKESKLKLSLETRHRGDVMIIHCQGRIVYRDEAVALSKLVGETLENGGKIVLDLSGVTSIDSAGIGELVLLHTWAQSRNADLKWANPSPLVRELLDLTHLDTVLDIYPSLSEALAEFQRDEVRMDC
jgi:anti-sigma B factor antagonist